MEKKKMRNKRKHKALAAVLYHIFYINICYLKIRTYFIKIDFYFIQKINKKVKDELCKKVVCPFCVAKGGMNKS